MYYLYQVTGGRKVAFYGTDAIQTFEKNQS